MAPFWKSNLGKVIIGGCGLQLGLLVSLVAAITVLALSLLCGLAALISFSVAQEVARLPTGTPIPANSIQAEELTRLLAEVDTLIAEMEALPNVSAGPPAPPLVVAQQNDVELYDGPDFKTNPVGLLMAGQSLEIIGRDTGAAWWLVALPNGRFAWAPAPLVTAINVTETVPVVTSPSQLAQPAASGPSFGATPGPGPSPSLTPTPLLPPGTPTPSAELERRFVEDIPAYSSIKASLMTPPLSASFSPDGVQIALTEGIKLYTFKADGSVPQIWLEDNAEYQPAGGAVWSPDGQYLAAVVEYKPTICGRCRSVALIRPADGELSFLAGPDGLSTDSPRWTQEGRLLVNVHPGEPADGVTYVYNIFGEGQAATGIYLLSTSHDGQKWYPWRPGRVWRAGVSERPDSYYND